MRRNIKDGYDCQSELSGLMILRIPLDIRSVYDEHQFLEVWPVMKFTETRN